MGEKRSWAWLLIGSMLITGTAFVIIASFTWFPRFLTGGACLLFFGVLFGEIQKNLEEANEKKDEKGGK